MPRENKINARKRNRLLRETGVVVLGEAYLQHATINATHVSPSAHRYQFPKIKKSESSGTLIGKKIVVRGYRASREQLAIGCDACPRKHNPKSMSSLSAATFLASLTDDAHR